LACWGVLPEFWFLHVLVPAPPSVLREGADVTRAVITRGDRSESAGRAGARRLRGCAVRGPGLCALMGCRVVGAHGDPGDLEGCWLVICARGRGVTEGSACCPIDKLCEVLTAGGHACAPMAR